MSSKIEQQVMAGVGLIYTVRKLISRTALEIYILALSALALWRLVWVHKVFENFWRVEGHGISAIATYLVAAVGHTHTAVQLTLAVAAIAFIALCVDIVRNYSSQETYAV